MATFSLLLFTHCATRPSTQPASGPLSELVKLETRPGVTQKFVLLQPKNPVASVILFSGGWGKIETSSSFGKPYIGKAKNFLVRTREMFVDHGFTVAVIDVPSDLKGKGMFDVWRLDDRHVHDIKGVTEYLKQKANIPVFLVGQSRGTISVANAGIKLRNAVDGLVFTSSITATIKTKNWKSYSAYPDGILNLSLDKIVVPVMIVAHEEDKCIVSPPSGALLLKEALINSSKVELKIYTGGKKPKETKGCTYWGAHSYYGIEDQVVSDISGFIKSNVKGP